MSRLYALVMAGGSGTRLWPMSRRTSPKQTMSLFGERTLLQRTIERIVTRVPPERVLVVTTEELLPNVREHVRQILGERSRHCTFLGEPVGRNTAPAIILGAMIVASRDPEGLVIAAPADHLVNDTCAFTEALDRSIEAARNGMIVTYGIRPTRPETGYGYIRCGGESGEVFLVDRFIEKPRLARAKKLLEDRSCYWNSGIFMFSVETILREARTHLPEMMRVFDGLDLETLQNLGEVYERIEPVSVDHGIMEKTDRAAVVPVSMGWSDIGSWDSVYEMLDKDSAGNAVRGRVIEPDTSGSLILSGGRLLGVIGMKDVIVVDTDDALLICPRGRSQEVRKVVDRLVKEGGREYEEHLTVMRPWGSYTVLEEGEGYKIKRIVVRPGASLSLQSHSRRSEHWVVLSGEARVTREGEVYTVGPNESTFVPLGARHRLENPGAVPLEIIEVQNGTYVGEDDIVRYEDSYGRAPRKDDR